MWGQPLSRGEDIGLFRWRRRAGDVRFRCTMPFTTSAATAGDSGPEDCGAGERAGHREPRTAVPRMAQSRHEQRHRGHGPQDPRCGPDMQGIRLQAGKNPRRTRRAGQGAARSQQRCITRQQWRRWAATGKSGRYGLCQRPAGRPDRSAGQLLEHLGHQRGDRRALRPGERDVGEQRVALERLDDRDDAVVAADPQVVALGDVVRAAPPANPGRPGTAPSAARCAPATAPRRR